MKTTWTGLLERILPLPDCGPYSKCKTTTTVVYENRATGTAVTASTPGTQWYRTCPRGMDLAADITGPALSGPPAKYGDVLTDIARKVGDDPALMQSDFSEALVGVHLPAIKTQAR